MQPSAASPHCYLSERGNRRRAALLLLLSRLSADTMETSFRSIVGCIDHATGRFCEPRLAVLPRKSACSAGSIIPSCAFRFGRRTAALQRERVAEVSAARVYV